jgi:hypothetical protein
MLAESAESVLSSMSVDSGIPSGFPNASSTGPVDAAMIPATPSGKVVSLFDGQVLENFHATRLVISHNDVSVRNFRITRDDRELWYAIALLKHPDTGEEVAGSLFEDGEIITRDSNGDPLPAWGTGINGSGFTARRLDISYMENGFACADCVIEDNYIHDMIEYDGAHDDGFAMTRGSDVVIKHNTILIPNQQTSAVILGTYSGPIDNVTIENNYLNGGAYTIYSRDNGNGFGAPTNITVRGNVFGRDYLYGILSADGDVTWEGNTWADTDEPIDEDGER